MIHWNANLGHVLVLQCCVESIIKIQVILQLAEGTMLLEVP